MASRSAWISLFGLIIFSAIHESKSRDDDGSS